MYTTFTNEKKERFLFYVFLQLLQDSVAPEVAVDDDPVRVNHERCRNTRYVIVFDNRTMTHPFQIREI